MRKITGQSSSFFTTIIGEVTTERVPFYARHDKVLVTDKIDRGCMGYLAILSPAPPQNNFFLPQIVGGICAEDIPMVKHGDIVSVSGNGEILVLWETDSQQNSLMLTEACNCLCRMCPQPPQKHDPALFQVALRTLQLLKGKRVEHICITGGEPTLFPDNFLAILSKCHADHPDANISVLTNAKKFSDETLTKAIASAVSSKDMFCVSLHSDIGSVHDEIVGRRNSYNETQEGIYNMAKNRIPVEIRHVITKLNYTRLPEFAEHMYRYFPFCSHYAFMSIEVHGLASENVESIYIDPGEYKELLRKAVLALNKRGLNVSIYNTPLCLCHEDVRSFSRRSISSWKNIWLDACSDCSVKEKCCGFFSTSAIKFSHCISPIS